MSDLKYTGLSTDSDPGTFKSVDGYVLCVTGLNEELQEEDIQDAFSEYGEIKNCVINLDRRTGYLRGYCLLEYQTSDEAKKTISHFNGSEFHG